MNYAKLGYLQWEIIRMLKEEQLERSCIYEELRTKFYPFQSKSQNRVAIKRAIRSLKERGIIDEHYSILGIKQ